MNAEDFVKNFYAEKKSLQTLYADDKESAVAQKIAKLNLSEPQLKIMHELLDDVLTDSFYTILMGLSGSSSIGDVQTSYEISDDEGNKIECDEIEEHAWSYFQEE